jgi:O-antigen/teichoic acid export membrane protein
MLFAATFLVNAGLNFLLNLLVAAVLAPEEFGRYALAAAVAVLVNGVAFTWFSMAAARFTSQRATQATPSIRATLDRSLWRLAIGVAGVAAVTAVAWPGYGMPGTLLSLTLIVGMLHGVFDYACALARARFLDRLYARIVLAKNAMSFVGMLGSAALLHDAHAVLIALGLSIVVSLLPVRTALRREQGGAFERAQLTDFLRYAAPIVAAVVLYQLIPFLSRWLLASRYGYAEAGQFSLAFDTLYRVVAAIGASLEFILFQLAVLTDEHHGREAAQIRVGQNVVIVIAALLPAAVGFWLVTPSLVGILVPPAFREGFAAYSVLLLPAVLAQCLITSALSAVFQLSRRTAPLVLAAFTGLSASVVLMAVLPRILGPGGFAWAQSGGMLVALGFTLALAFPVLRNVVRIWDVAWVVAGCLAMVAALWPWRGMLSPVVELPAAIVLGGAAYAAVFLAADVAGVRIRLMGAYSGFRSRPREA